MPAFASAGGDCLEPMQSCSSSEKPGRCPPTNCWPSSSRQDEATRHPEASPTPSAASSGEGGSSTQPTDCAPSLVDDHAAGHPCGRQHAPNSSKNAPSKDGRSTPRSCFTQLPKCAVPDLEIACNLSDRPAQSEAAGAAN